MCLSIKIKKGVATLLLLLLLGKSETDAKIGRCGGVFCVFVLLHDDMMQPYPSQQLKGDGSSNSPFVFVVFYSFCSI
jgi:hypothetical protein